MSGRRILLGCWEVPGYGGASTSAYSLYRRMLRDGLDVCFVNLVADGELAFLRSAFGPTVGNPEKLPGVGTWPVQERWATPDDRVIAGVEELAPDVILGIGYIAAHILKGAAPARPLVFLTAGCRQAKAYMERGVRDTLALQRLLRNGGSWPLEDPREPEAVQRADLVVTHSEEALEQFRAFYARWSGKIHPEAVSFAEWILDDTLAFGSARRPFAERKIDVLFVANDWRRPEKNWPLVRKLARRLAGTTIHVAGGNAPPLPGVVDEGLVGDRERLFGLMGNAKAVVSPFLRGAAPGILFEASAMGCNLVASKNSGNWPICHPELLVDPPRTRTYVDRIRRSFTQKFDDRLDSFLEKNSYAELVEILHVV